jgi:hypothetical protein
MYELHCSKMSAQWKFGARFFDKRTAAYITKYRTAAKK